MICTFYYSEKYHGDVTLRVSRVFSCTYYFVTTCNGLFFSSSYSITLDVNLTPSYFLINTFECFFEYCESLNNKAIEMMFRVTICSFFCSIQIRNKRELKSTLIHRKLINKRELNFTLIAYETSLVRVKFSSQSERDKS